MSLIETIQRTMFVKPHPAGYPFIGGALAVSLVLLIIFKPLGITGLLLTAFIYYFFRDPVRLVPQREGLVVAPADGRVIAVKTGQTLPDDLIEEDDAADYTKISIFLSVLDAHVNRVPVGGEILKTFYYEGKFINAEMDKASEENERSAALIKLDNDKLVAFTQIAGLIARRIITTLEPGQKRESGEKFGLIRFGSRMDVYLPKGVNSLVCEGQRTLAGETVLADYKSKEKTRTAKPL
jgi:phosphatidylserine decarboxylase